MKTCLYSTTIEYRQNQAKTRLTGKRIQNYNPGNLKKFKQYSSYFDAQCIQLCSKYTQKKTEVEFCLPII